MNSLAYVQRHRDTFCAMMSNVFELDHVTDGLKCEIFDVSLLFSPSI